MVEVCGVLASIEQGGSARRGDSWGENGVVGVCGVMGCLASIEQGGSAKKG